MDGFGLVMENGYGSTDKTKYKRMFLTITIFIRAMMSN